MRRIVLRDVKRFFAASLFFILIAGYIGFGIVRRGASVDFQSFYSAGYQLRTHPSHMFNLARQEETQHERTAASGFIPFYHPSYEALLFAPFSFLDYQTAYLSFMALNMLLLVAAFFAVRPALGAVDPAWQSRSGAILFLFVPLLVAFVQGQDSMLSLLLYCLVWRQLESGNDTTAGCLLALAMFKFHFALPIAVLITALKGWKFASGFLITCVGVFLLCLGIVAPSGLLDHFRLLTGAISAIDRDILAEKLALDPHTMHNIAGLVYAMGEWLFPSSLVFNALSSIAGLGVLGWCIHAVRKYGPRTAFAIAILCGLLVSYHFLFYDLTLVLLPLALLAGRIHRFILISLFILPVLEMILGFNWGFLMAVPLLLTLIYVIATAPQLSELEGKVVAAIPT